VHYAQEARVRLAPKVSQAAQQARDTALVQYDAHLQPRIQQGLQQARGALPPKVDAAAIRAAKRARKVARQAADYTAPRIGQAVAATEPVREEAVQRSAAALAALRNPVTAADIERLATRRRLRARCARGGKRFLVFGVLAAGAVAAWKWWDKQANPDWLVEPPAATEPADRPPLTSVDGSDTMSLEAKAQQVQQAEAEEGKRGHEH
jgi:hypothetical protein